MKTISAAGLKITPDIPVGRAGDEGGGLVQVLLAQLVRQQRAESVAVTGVAVPPRSAGV